MQNLINIVINDKTCSENKSLPGIGSLLVFYE